MDNNNNNASKELYVQNINSKSLRLKWNPQEYNLFKAVKNNYYTPEQYKNNEYFKSIKHRLSLKNNGKIVFNDDLTSIYFTLQPNQVLLTKYANIYEGNPKDILPPAPVLNSDDTEVDNITNSNPPVQQLDTEQKQQLDIFEKEMLPALLSPGKAENSMNKDLREMIEKLNR